MLEAHSTFARWALLASFVAATAIACGSSDEESADSNGDAAPSKLVPEGGSASDGGASKPSDGGTTTQPNPGTDGSTTQPSGNCGLALKGPKWNPSCQSWMNDNCCEAELACATDTACKKLVDCIGACKGQNTDACVQACEQDTPAGQGLLSTMGACSKSAPADGGAAIPTKCAWP